MDSQEKIQKRYEVKKCHTKIDYAVRAKIQSLLEHGLTVSSIAKKLNLCEKTISNEIHRGKVKTEGYILKDCSLIKNHKYIVCNQCPKHEQCQHDKIYYDCNSAEEDAYEKRCISHMGTRLTTSEIKVIKSTLEPRLNKSHSIEVIYNDEPKLSELRSSRQIRRLITNGTIDIPLTKLHQTVQRSNQYKFNYSKEDREKIAVYKADHLFSDFKKYINLNKDSIQIQLDSVIGCKTDLKKLLTIYFVKEKFQIGRLYNVDNQSNNVYHILAIIIKIISEEITNKKIVFLADNGIEFTKIIELEKLSFGNEIHTFFTHVYCSTDKAECENNHKLVRYVYPKGHTFDNLTQEEIDSTFSNINSYSRRSIGYETPTNLFIKDYSLGLLKKLGIVEVPSKAVDLSRKW